VVGTFSFGILTSLGEHIGSNKMAYRKRKGAVLKKWLAVPFFLLVALLEAAYNYHQPSGSK